MDWLFSELGYHGRLEATDDLIVIILEQITEITTIVDVGKVGYRELHPIIFVHINTNSGIEDVQSRIAVEGNNLGASRQTL